MTTIKTIFNNYTATIDRLDLELIIAHELKKTREFVLAHPECKLKEGQNLRIKHLVARRAKHEPLAYILGHKGFYGLDFKVNKNTLVPRPETELLVEEILKLAPKNKTILDIGTGSGNIIISLAKNLKGKNTFYGLDISSKTLRVAKQNAATHSVSKKIKFLRGNLLSPILGKKKLDNAIVAANLPYLDLNWKNLLKSSDTKGLKYEPHVALYSGSDGLDAYRELANQLRPSARKNIIVFCEIGHLQKRELAKIFNFADKIQFSKDLAGRWRVARIVI
jgi:release factor glutamine methyltransferase